MNRTWWILLAASALAAAPLGEPGRALAIEDEVRRIAVSSSGAEALWPGFDPRTVPLAVYDGERTYLFRHPAPPPEFNALEGGRKDDRTSTGRHDAVTANTSADIGGVSTATLLVDRGQSERSVRDLAAVAIHESFHVYQRARHPSWIGNEADLFTYPVDAAEPLALRRLETEALRRALAAEDSARARCWARRALALRTERYGAIEAAFAAYERGTELNEGLATYVEMRAAGRRTVDLPAAEFAPAEVRRRAYATGTALAMLLDRFEPGWPVAFEKDDSRTLDGALTTTTGAGDACAFDEAVVVAARKKAVADVAALAGERERRLAAFAAKSGTRVVVEAGGEPLWPQGFDPLNVERVGAGRVLHTRFVKLGNAAGQLEVLNAEALTDGVGPHPLFQGVRRVELTGLPQPEIGETDGKVVLRAAGLTLEFRAASVTRDGDVITVRLSP